MQNKNLSRALIVGIPTIIILIAVVFAGFRFISQPTNNTNNAANVTQTQTQDITVTVTDKSGNKSSYKVGYESGQTAFQVMQKLQSQNNGFTFTYNEDPTFGPLITSINGFAPDATVFWEFLINEKSSQVGVATYKVQPGDRLGFTVTKIQAN